MTANRWRNDVVLMSRPEHRHQMQQALQEFFDINALSTDNPFTMWNLHKAFIRGALMKQSSIARKLRTQQLNDILTSIKHLEHSHKQNPQPHTLVQLTQARRDLRKILMSQHHKQMKSWKANFYFHGNKADRLLAQQLKDKTFKQKLPYLYHPQTGEKLLNPQDMANAFSIYYSSIYNLQSQESTPQPTPELIDEFLNSISLPSLTPDDRSILNQPFTQKEILKAIQILPHSKAPSSDGFSSE